MKCLTCGRIDTSVIQGECVLCHFNRYYKEQEELNKKWNSNTVEEKIDILRQILINNGMMN